MTAAATTGRELRFTPQRRAVLEVLTASSDHPTAAEVYQRVRDHVPGIGAATVYRTLGLLVREGRALELRLGDGAGAAARFDANVGRHDHLICDRCGSAVDVDSPVPDQLVQEVAAASGFAVTSYDLQFRGLCPQCHAAQATP